MTSPLRLVVTSIVPRARSAAGCDRLVSDTDMISAVTRPSVQGKTLIEPSNTSTVTDGAGPQAQLLPNRRSAWYGPLSWNRSYTTGYAESPSATTATATIIRSTVNRTTGHLTPGA